MSSRSRDRVGAGDRRGPAAWAALWVACLFVTCVAARAAEDDCCGGVPATRPATAPAGGPRVIRVSADPNNLPFSNDKLEGFENKIADLIASDLGARIEYVWRAQRRGFFRMALKEKECDLVLGVPAGFERALTTVPYYRSGYVFVARQGSPGAAVRSLDDPALRSLKVAVQLAGDDGADTPPAHALAARHVVDNMVGFTLYGDYAEPNPPARIVDAVARGDADVAMVWGPLAGYFAGRQPGGALELAPVTPERDPTSGLRFTFDIAMGVRRPDKAFRDELNAVLARRQPDIDRILDVYHVPRLARETSASRPATRSAGEAPEAKHGDGPNSR
ncbi:MAG: quinoprotein dehydrogenase-associated transporter substrate-binding protein [Phycisphaerales bacterium]|nr:quinoprotein dehydrogenase-associated transporter substrate-binding protein [Phycisphaerales bacterium]